MITILQNLKGYRKFLIMVLVIVALSVLLACGLLTGPEFNESLKFISAAFFAANFGGKLASKEPSAETKKSNPTISDSAPVLRDGAPVSTEPKTQ